MWVELCPLKRYDQVLTPKTYAYDLSLHFLVDDDSECLFMCLCPSLDLFPDSFPGMGPGATATGHADRARQWFAGRPAVHQKEPGEQSQDKGVGLDTFGYK